MSDLRAVLVTGTSTGIGYACIQTLANAGFIVFAGVRDEHAAQRVSELHGNVRAILLDVTSSQQITAAAQAVAASGVKLCGVVNNAGIAVGGPLEFLPLDEVRRLFEINFFGALAVTQAMLPLLRQTPDARIVFVGSVSGQIAAPFVGPYSASKFALEALADAMRMELAAFGIRVSVIQPGNVRTPIWQKGRDARAAMTARMPMQAQEYYSNAIDAMVRLTEHEERTGIDSSLVAQAVLQALMQEHPRARYAVGNPPAWQRRMATLLPERLRDRLVLKAIFGR